VAKPFDQWYQGPWRIIKADTVASRVRLQPGEIMPHRSGALILNCPACNTMQVAHAQIQGSPEAPTLSAPVHCGKGYCQRCGVWFTVIGGCTREAERPKARITAIPDRLQRAGVRHAPSLEAALRRRSGG